MFPEIITVSHVTQTLKAEVMLWTDVNYQEMEMMDNMHSIADLESVLCNVLEVNLAEPKRGLLLDLYVQTVLFSREHSLKREQTSTLLSIIKSVHEANIITPLDNIKQCFRYCQDLLLCHSVRRPPFSINLFSPGEIYSALYFIHDIYLRHYKLYKYIFTPQVKLNLSLTYSGIPDVKKVVETKAGRGPKTYRSLNRGCIGGSKIRTEDTD